MSERYTGWRLRLWAAWWVLRGEPVIFGLEFRRPLRLLNPRPSVVNLVGCRAFGAAGRPTVILEDLTPEERWSAREGGEFTEEDRRGGGDE